MRSWKEDGAWRPPSGRANLPLGFSAGLAAGLALLGLLSAGGGVSGRLDLLNHATPLFLLGGLAAFLIGWLAPAQPYARALAALGLAGAVAAGWRVVPEWLSATSPPPATSEASGRQIRVLTQNVWDHNPDPHGTARALAGAGADIILLQELETPQAKLVARDLELTYPFHADCTLVNRWCSLAIVSRLPIIAWSYHQGGWKAPAWDRLVLVRATIDAPGLPLFDVVCSKLAHPYTADHQQTQIVRLVAKLRGLDQDHAILGGDFNLTPWSFTLGRIDGAIGLVRRTRGLMTWPNRLPTAKAPLMPLALLPIDQVYAGPAWRTVSVQRGPRTGSDHYGALVTLASRNDRR